MSETTIGVIGLGFVGGAIYTCLKAKKCTVKGYDLYKDSDTFEDTLSCDALFLCLPTVYSSSLKEYNKGAIVSTCEALAEQEYGGIVMIKSTVEPGTTESLAAQFPSLRLVHNPEFLTAATALKDFREQRHIVLGKSKNVQEGDMDCVVMFYITHFPRAHISLCTCVESESMKIFANSFYAVKIQFFNEMYAMCQHTGADYETVRDMIVKNGWVNPMHTDVPGTDGKLSYGGLCFPKDTNAIMQRMSKAGLPCAVIDAAIAERNSMRDDEDNCE